MALEGTTKCYMCQLDRFMEFAEAYFNLEKQPEVIEEIKDLAEVRREGAWQQAALSHLWAVNVASRDARLPAYLYPATTQEHLRPAHSAFIEALRQADSLYEARSHA